MSYFIRISHQNNPGNKLQTYIVSLLEKYDHVLSDDPEALYNRVDELVKQANRAHPRCTGQRANINRTYPSKEINSMSVSGLITLSVHKIAGRLNADLKIISQQEPAKPTPAPPPEPEPEPDPNDQPRQAIWISREHQRVHTYIEWSKFSVPVQALLKKGAVWNAYYDGNTVLVEEYGGKTHPAY